MKIKFKLYLMIVSAIIAVIFPRMLLAGSWLLKYDEWFTSNGVYYSIPFKYGEKGSIEDGVINGFTGLVGQKLDYSIQNSQQKIGYTNFFEYGLKDNMNVSGSVDIEQIYDQINISTKDNTDTYNFSLTSQYWKLITQFAVKTQIMKRDKDVLSGSIKLFPGPLFITNNTNHYFNKTRGIGAGLNYGYSPAVNYYIDTQVAYKHYPSISHHQLDTTIVAGIKPTSYMLCQIGVYNTFNGLNFDKRIFKRENLVALVNNSTWSPENKAALLKEIDYSMRTVSKTNDHKLSLKYGYEFSENKMVNVEWFTNIFSAKSFKDNTIFLSYNVKI